MNVPMDREELSLARYACQELSNRRAEQALEGRISNSEWAKANENEARAYRRLADKLGDLESEAQS